MAGLAVIVLLAAGGVTAYLVAFAPGKPHHPAPLPSKVVGVQTVGLVSQGSQSASSAQLFQLLGAHGAPQFSPLAPSQVTVGQPQWTADQMAGGTYIFIYLPTGKCLTATGRVAHPTVQLQHCDLSANQRWRRTLAPVLTAGHSFYQYQNAAEQGCLSQASALPGNAYGVGLAACETSPQADQLIAFWWGSV